jgi:hypothetical protein
MVTTYTFMRPPIYGPPFLYSCRCLRGAVSNHFFPPNQRPSFLVAAFNDRRVRVCARARASPPPNFWSAQLLRFGGKIIHFSHPNPDQNIWPTKKLCVFSSFSKFHSHCADDSSISATVKNGRK